VRLFVDVGAQSLLSGDSCKVLICSPGRFQVAFLNPLSSLLKLSAPAHAFTFGFPSWATRSRVTRAFGAHDPKSLDEEPIEEIPYDSL